MIILIAQASQYFMDPPMLFIRYYITRHVQTAWFATVCYYLSDHVGSVVPALLS